jgi:hypothetical protein
MLLAADDIALRAPSAANVLSRINGTVLPRRGRTPRFSQVTFSNVEVFTDIPEGERRTTDLIARVVTLEGEPELILVHLEVQAERRSVFPFRMCEYYMLLRLRHRLPVFPVVVYLAPGAGGLVRETYTESLFDEEILRFHYHAIGLPDLSADDYRELDNPLAPALSALMRPSRFGRLSQKVHCLRRVLVSDVDEARKSLLVNVIEKYMSLSLAEQAEFETVMEQDEVEEVREMLTVYEERGILKGERRMILSLLRRKFGELPADVIARIESMQTEAELEALSGRVLEAGSLSELELSSD